MKRFRFMTLVVLLTAIVVGANAREFTLSSFPSIDEVQAVNEGEDEDPVAAALVTRADVPLVFQNDETYPWTVVDNTIKNGNCGIKNSTSVLTISYYASIQTELSFDWRSYSYSNHQPLKLFIDGVQTATTNNSSYTSQRFYLPAGEHIIVFKDSIGNSTSTSNYSYIKNLQVKEMKPLETAVLTDNSLPMTFTNDDTWPWTIEDGYVQSSNYYHANSSSKFSTTITIDSMSILSFQVLPTYVNGTSLSTSYSDYHRFYFRLKNNNTNWNWYWYWNNATSYNSFRIPLESGIYTLEWQDTIYNNSSYKFVSRVRNIKLDRNWVNVELATPGTLGYEVLYSEGVDVLNDVEMLKVKGTMNSSDWTDIKNMNNLTALDLSEANIEAIPNSAFAGLSKLSWVKLPEGLQTIGQYAFQNTQIWSIVIPSSVTEIGVFAFSGTRINKVTFAANSKLKTICNGAFYNCNSLSKIDVPNSVTVVGYAAFQDCSNLKEITFSDGMTSIWDYTCSGCSALNKVDLPKNLTNIGYCAFYNTSSLRSLEIPDKLNRIWDYAFYNSGIDSLKLPISMQYLHSYSFSNCKNLRYIEMPSYLVSGNSYVTYYYASGTNIGNSSRTMYYGYYYNFESCSAIEKVVMRSATPPAITYDPFSNARAKSSITLVVPSFSVVNYKLDTYWYQFGSIIEGDDVDYWKITSPLMLTNNRRMQGTPDVDLYYGGQLTVGGNAPMTMGQFNMYVNESNPGRLLNTCETMSADQATTKFSVDANKWYFFTPIHDVAVADIQVSNGASYVFRYYDAQNRATNGASGSWKNVDTEKLQAGQGYIFHCNTACTITFPVDAEGQLQLFRTDDVTRTLAVNEATTTANRSWNYVGNPYPCYYDIYYMDFTAPITVWNGSTYQAYSIADDEFVLRPMQSFFVQKPDAVDIIVFHKEGRQLTTSIAHGASARMLAPAHSNRHVFDLQLVGGEQLDQTRVVINDEAQMGYELERDAAKFMSFDTSVPQLFTLDGEGNNYAINERPLSNGQITLAYYAGQEGFYTIKQVRADGEVYLYDSEQGKTINLTEEDYTFYAEATAGINNTRFVLTFKVNSGEVTGIEQRLDTVENGLVYDLQGRKTTATQKGVYVKDGRKVVNK